MKLNRLWKFLLLLSLIPNYPLFQEERIFKEKTDAHPQSREQWAQQEKDSFDPTPGLGTKEIPRADGGKDKIYYSISTPEEEKKAPQEEKDKVEKSWDMLKGVIIDRRKQ